MQRAYRSRRPQGIGRSCSSSGCCEQFEAEVAEVEVEAMRGWTSRSQFAVVDHAVEATKQTLDRIYADLGVDAESRRRTS
jgi:hypothetical protein